MPHVVPRRGKLVLALAALSLTTALYAQQASFSSLEERMSYKEFREYGLDKLSPEQLKGLNEWLVKHGAASTTGVAAPGAAAPLGGAQTAAEASKIVSRIKGEFKGWQQGSVLTLENGQKWEILDDDTLYAHSDRGPEVTIEKGGLIGGWRLTVEGYGNIAHVMPVTK